MHRSISPPWSSRFGRGRSICGLSCAFFLGFFSLSSLLSGDPVAAFREVKIGSEGPWGVLETYEMRLEPPLTYAEAALKSDSRELVWRFMGQTPQTLGEVLTRAGLSQEQVSRLTEPTRVRVLEDRIEVIPPSDVVFALAPQVRGRVYELLKGDPENNIYRFPYVLDSRWYDESQALNGIDEEVVEAVRKLTYFEESVRVFADMALVLDMIDSEEQRLSLVRSLLRERSLAVRLCIDHSSDLETLANYWAAGGRNREILPILESVLTTQGVERLDLVHLLPPLPRMLLYTYASPQMAVGTTRPDCFWTAANFLNYDPSDRFLDQRSFENRLTERFEEISGPPRFGDLVLISDEDQKQPMHACNYLADGLVFTKNGRSFSRPWVVDRLEEVVSGYLKTPNVSVRYFRQKPLIHNRP